MEQIVSTAQMLHIAQRALNHVDARLIGHGERVATVVYQILKQHPRLSSEERANLCIMALLHDIGAYKTEEIDDLLTFETSGVWEHSAYGYMFLKKLSPLDDNARPVLYHHLAFDQYSEADDPLAPDDFAGLLCLADRADMITMSKGGAFCLEYIKKHSGHQFSPVWVELFLQANEAYGILEQLEQKNTSAVFHEMVECITLSPQEISQYLSMIAYSIDFRSEFMVLHTVTTVSVSQVLGKIMNLSDEEQEALYYGSLLHDIGKVACPVEILEKPGKLTPEEMDVMRRHVVVTREILCGLIDPVILNIAARHHEKLGGTGYPDGLCAEDLTKPERIAAVADIVSALIRRRSYKEAFNREKTMAILASMRDAGELCPVTTNMMLENFDDIIAAVDNFGGRITRAYQSIRQNYISLLAKLPLQV